MLRRRAQTLTTTSARTDCGGRLPLQSTPAIGKLFGLVGRVLRTLLRAKDDEIADGRKPEEVLARGASALPRVRTCCDVAAKLRSGPGRADFSICTLRCGRGGRLSHSGVDSPRPGGHQRWIDHVGIAVAAASPERGINPCEDRELNARSFCWHSRFSQGDAHGSRACRGLFSLRCGNRICPNSAERRSADRFTT
jgi:hypothetical protein